MNTQTTAMMERTPFLLPDVAATDTGFTKEELAGDIDGLQLGFQRVKIPEQVNDQLVLTRLAPTGSLGIAAIAVVGTVGTEAAGSAVAHLAVRGLAGGRGIVVIVLAGRPVGVGVVAVDDDALQGLGVVRVVRVLAGQLKLDRPSSCPCPPPVSRPTRSS